MPAETTHACTAEHCVVCCPSARAYSDGVQVGKDLYTPAGATRELETATVALVGGLVGALFVACVTSYGRRDS